MLFEVIADYKSEDNEPVELLVGDTVQLGESSDPNGLYPNWIFCTTEKNGKAGWTPVHILSIQGAEATVKEDYSSKEMEVNSGDIVESVHELNGWHWCIRVSDLEKGWVAKDNLKLKA